MSTKKTVFFDRDGTLIIDKVYLNDPDQIEYLPHVFDSLKLLRDAGFQFIVVTNQSGIARGIVSVENLHEIHRRITNEFLKHDITFAGFYHAPYSVESQHPMRKPNPGMLLAATQDHTVNLSASWMIGDRASDVFAGQRAGCRTVLLEGVETSETIAQCQPTLVCDGLWSATQVIIANP